MVLEKTFPPDERVENELDTLIDSGHNITFICYSKSNNKEIYYHKKAKVISFPISQLMQKKGSALALTLPFYFWFWKKMITSVLKTEPIDVLHIHDLPLISVGNLLKKKYGIKLVLDLHENRPEIMKHYHHTNTIFGKLLISINKWKEYEKSYIKKADKLILVTNEAKKWYQEKYHIRLENTFVVPNFANLKVIEANQKKFALDEIWKNKKLVVYLGDTGLRRGTLTILQAAKEMEKCADSYHFIIIGTSKEQSKLVDYIKKNNLGNAQLLGWKSLESSIGIIKNAYVGLCPLVRNIHHDTTFANKIFLYLACKIPVIVSDCTAQKNFVESYQCGLVFEAENHLDLQKKLLMLENDSFYHKLKSMAETTSKTEGNWEKSAQTLLELYRSLEFE
jgi:glycosyltransferase involved in cell wall biosynthesis